MTNQVGTWTTKQIYTYDALNRLDSTQETNGSTTTYWTEDEAYDRYGNRWEVVGGLPTLSFNSTNNRISTAGYSYDLSGNLTNDTANTYAYDAENRIKTVNGVANTFVYDGEGKRVKKYFPQGEQLRFVYGVSGQLLMEFDTNNGALKKEYVYGTDGLLATIEPTIGTKYATADHLGSPRVITNSAGAVVSRHDYRAFGRELLAGEGGRTAALGFGVSDDLRQKFTGYERDNETGLDYAQARYYSSTQGRFTSSDPLNASARIRNPQTWNRYAYVLNSPLRFIDPLGLAEGKANNITVLDGGHLTSKRKRQPKPRELTNPMNPNAPVPGSPSLSTPFFLGLKYSDNPNAQAAYKLLVETYGDNAESVYDEEWTEYEQAVFLNTVAALEDADLSWDGVKFVGFLREENPKNDAPYGIILSGVTKKTLDDAQLGEAGFYGRRSPKDIHIASLNPKPSGSNWQIDIDLWNPKSEFSNHQKEIKFNDNGNATTHPADVTRALLDRGVRSGVKTPE